MAVSDLMAALALFVSVASFFFAWRADVISRRPVLVILYDGDRGWVLRNVGNGPALNIIVAQKKPKGEWFNPVRVPALAREQEFVMTWLGHVNTTGLGATYEDFKGRVYSSTCGNDLSRTYSGNMLEEWPEAESAPHWNQP